ncbi:MAG: Bax inhibitor-1 family protein [Acidobacteriota bacterium]|nr:Bax inhibitor-1 family protein [Acidobacteriota bacterium]
MTTRSLSRPEVSADARAQFIHRTYGHLFGAILVFVAFEAALFGSGIADRMARAMMQVPWGLILGAFLLIAWFATRLAHRMESRSVQYLGLGTYIVAKGVIFVPLLYRAERVADGLINQAAQVTLLGALGLTIVAFSVKNDFSSLRPYLYWGGTVALILIVAALVFGFRLGTWFSVGMIALSGGSILYDTAKIARRYRGDQYVGAALGLFASIGMMFWYVLRLFTRAQRG